MPPPLLRQALLAAGLVLLALACTVDGPGTDLCRAGLGALTAGCLVWALEA